MRMFTTMQVALISVNLGAWCKEIHAGGRLTFDLIVLLTSINFRVMVAEKLPEISCEQFPPLTACFCSMVPAQLWLSHLSVHPSHSSLLRARMVHQNKRPLFLLTATQM